jgi:predicted phage baseplate assembly protein
MYLPAPNLDDRHFQDLVDEAKRSISRYCPNWTDHNVSDPGVTLIELFAWMTEQYLFRLNQVPEKNFITFLDLIGVRLQPTQPAKGDVTFTLSAPPTRDRRISIPAWTEVATERTESEEAITFTTDEEAVVLSPTLLWVQTSADGYDFEDHSQVRKGEMAFTPWANPPREPQAFYLGFDEDLSAHTLVLEFECDGSGIGINPEKPPWRWEVWRRGNELKWEYLKVASGTTRSLNENSDTTRGLNENGEITLLLPYYCHPLRLGGREARTWLRCSPVDNPGPGERPCARPPRIRRIGAYTIGITVPVTHALPVREEIVGISNGRPAQRFRLQHSNVLKPAGPDEGLEVETEHGDWEPWQAVADFGDSGENDKHYVLDLVSGQIEFGPAIRQTNGTEPQFGAIPPTGRRIRMRRYRIGGGVQGNISEGRVKVLKTTLPHVRGVHTRVPLTGGEDAQTLEDAKLKGPKTLRTRWRAVTVDDFEYLAEQIEGVGRVRCLQPRPSEPGAPPPGTVLLLVVPSLPRLEGAELERYMGLHETLPQLPPDERARTIENLQNQLMVPPNTKERLREHLDDRRLLTTRMEIREPQYVWVAIQTTIKPHPKADPERVRRDVKEALYRYVHPLYGGLDGNGWPFGQPLTIDKVYALIQRVDGVEYATELKLFPIDMAKSQLLGINEQVIQVPPHGVIVSYYHNVRVG